MKKVLFTASLERHLRRFHTPYIQYLQEIGYEVHTAANGENMIPFVDRHHEINFQRSPFKLANFGVYRSLKRLIDENEYVLVHCHTPVASILARLASIHLRGQGRMKLVYSCHGFHFYRGGSPVKNFVYRSVEKFMSRYADCIVATNHEDYDAMETYRFKMPHRYLVLGVGVDGSQFVPVTPERKKQLRDELGIPQDRFVLLCPGEYNVNKNPVFLVRSMVPLVERDPGFLLLLPGEGTLRGELDALVDDLDLGDHVRVLGYQKNIAEWYGASDVDVGASRREGLGMHLVEATSMGLPGLVTDIRGYTDVIRHNENGLVYKSFSTDDFVEKALLLKNDKALYGRLSKTAIEYASEFYIENTLGQFKEIYAKMLA